MLWLLNEYKRIWSSIVWLAKWVWPYIYQLWVRFCPILIQMKCRVILQGISSFWHVARERKAMKRFIELVRKDLRAGWKALMDKYWLIRHWRMYNWRKIFLNFVLMVLFILPFILLFKFVLWFYSKLVIYVFHLVDIFFLDFVLLKWEWTHVYYEKVRSIFWVIFFDGVFIYPKKFWAWFCERYYWQTAILRWVDILVRFLQRLQRLEAWIIMVSLDLYERVIPRYVINKYYWFRWKWPQRKARVRQRVFKFFKDLPVHIWYFLLYIVLRCKQICRRCWYAVRRVYRRIVLWCQSKAWRIKFFFKYQVKNRIVWHSCKLVIEIKFVFRYFWRFPSMKKARTHYWKKILPKLIFVYLALFDQGYLKFVAVHYIKVVRLEWYCFTLDVELRMSFIRWRRDHFKSWLIVCVYDIYHSLGAVVYIFFWPFVERIFLSHWFFCLRTIPAYYVNKCWRYFLNKYLKVWWNKFIAFKPVAKVYNKICLQYKQWDRKRKVKLIHAIFLKKRDPEKLVNILLEKDYKFSVALGHTVTWKYRVVDGKLVCQQFGSETDKVKSQREFYEHISKKLLDDSKGGRWGFHNVKPMFKHPKYDSSFLGSYLDPNKEYTEAELQALTSKLRQIQYCADKVYAHIKKNKEAKQTTK